MIKPIVGESVELFVTEMLKSVDGWVVEFAGAEYIGMNVDTKGWTIELYTMDDYDQVQDVKDLAVVTFIRKLDG